MEDKRKLIPVIKVGDLVCFKERSHCGIIYKVTAIDYVPSKYEETWGRKFRCTYVPVFSLFKEDGFSAKTVKHATGNGDTDFGMTLLCEADVEKELERLKTFTESAFLVAI